MGKLAMLIKNTNLESVLGYVHQLTNANKCERDLDVITPGRV
jgi:hypothetical protein